MPRLCTEKPLLPCCFLSRRALSLGPLSSSCSCSSTAHPNVAPAPISTSSPVGRRAMTATTVCFAMTWDSDSKNGSHMGRGTGDKQTDRQRHTSALAASCPRRGIRDHSEDLACCHGINIMSQSFLTAHTHTHTHTRRYMSFPMKRSKT